MDDDMKLSAIGQIDRTVTVIEGARNRYRDVLGFEHLYSFGSSAFFDGHRVQLVLSEGDGSALESIIYFTVDDVRTAAATLAKRRVKSINAAHLISKHDDGTEEWMAFFADNDGRPLAIMSTAKPNGAASSG